MTARDDLLAALVDERFGPIPPPLRPGVVEDTLDAQARRRQELTDELRAWRARRRAARIRAARLAADQVPPPQSRPDDDHAARLLAGVTKEPTT